MSSPAMESSPSPLYPDPTQTSLQLRFAKLAGSLGADPDASETWSAAFVRRYTEPQRHYHTLNHVNAMLRCLDTHRDKLANPLAVELAIVFHDWIYDPRGKENEAESIMEFEKFARQLGMEAGLTAIVTRLIDATVAHQVPKDMSRYEQADLQFFLDFDLEVLGRSWEDYSAYAVQIRQEYNCFNDEEFCRGRAKLLRNFQARERIFFSQEYFQESEKSARDNISKEIDQLERNLV